jgi:hypothetical protein
MDRRKLRRRVTAVFGVIALLGALVVALTAAPAVATPVPPSTSNCTYNGNPSAVSGVSAGTVINVSCTGMPASATLALAQASPLAGVADPASAGSGFADQTHIVIGSSDASGNFTGSFTVHATGDATNPFTPSNGNPDAVCPPTTAQINAGLVGCALAIANVATLQPVNTATLVFTGSPAPASPTLALNPNANVFPGNVLNASDLNTSGFWWGAPLTGAPNAAAGVPGFSVTVGGVNATNNFSASPTAYCVTGAVTPMCSGKAVNTLVPPALSGTLTVPSPTPPNGTVVATEPNTTPVGNQGSVTASATITFQTTAPTLTANPSSGGPGTGVSLAGDNWNSQGGPVTVAFTTANSGQTVDSVQLTPNGSGHISGSITVNTTNEAVGPNPLVATQGTLTATAPFTVTSLSTSCTTSGSPNSCQTNQVVTQQVNGVSQGLVVNEAGLNVTMAPITLNGHAQTSTGNLNQISFIDERGTLVGWSLTAQFNGDNFTCTPISGTGSCPGSHPIDNTIPATNFLLKAPTVVCMDAGDPSTVPPTPPSCVISEVTQAAGNEQVPGPSGSAVSLGSAANGGGGGSVLINSPLSLLVPAYVAAGNYSNTLNVTAT